MGQKAELLPLLVPADRDRMGLGHFENGLAAIHADYPRYLDLRSHSIDWLLTVNGRINDDNGRHSKRSSVRLFDCSESVRIFPSMAAPLARGVSQEQPMTRGPRPTIG